MEYENSLVSTSFARRILKHRVRISCIIIIIIIIIRALTAHNNKVRPTTDDFREEHLEPVLRKTSSYIHRTRAAVVCFSDFCRPFQSLLVFLYASIIIDRKKKKYQNREVRNSFVLHANKRASTHNTRIPCVCRFLEFSDHDQVNSKKMFT